MLFVKNCGNVCKSTIEALRALRSEIIEKCTIYKRTTVACWESTQGIASEEQSICSYIVEFQVPMDKCEKFYICLDR